MTPLPGEPCEVCGENDVLGQITTEFRRKPVDRYDSICLNKDDGRVIFHGTTDTDNWAYEYERH